MHLVFVLFVSKKTNLYKLGKLSSDARDAYGCNVYMSKGPPVFFYMELQCPELHFSSILKM